MIPFSICAEITGAALAGSVGGVFRMARAAFAQRHVQLIRFGPGNGRAVALSA
jgi:hypothetical protein